jgi:phage shock protein C
MNRVYRSTTDKIIAGVCGGLGQYLRIEPLILRILFIILAMNGIGLGLYIILWIFLPLEQKEYPDQEAMIRHNVNEISEQVQAWSRGTQDQSKLMLILGGILIGVGILALLNNFGLLWWVNAIRLWPLLLVALGAALLLNSLKDKR